MNFSKAKINLKYMVMEYEEKITYEPLATSEIGM